MASQWSERGLTDEALLDMQIAAALDEITESPEEIEALKVSTRAWIASIPDEIW
jgi:hypothetical protein